MTSYQIFKQNGDIELISKEIDLKIDSTRNLFRRIKLPGYEESRKYYVNVDKKIPPGMSIQDKEFFLIDLRNKVMQQLVYKRELESKNVHSSNDEKEQEGED